MATFSSEHRYLGALYDDCLSNMLRTMYTVGMPGIEGGGGREDIERVAG